MRLAQLICYVACRKLIPSALAVGKNFDTSSLQLGGPFDKAAPPPSLGAAPFDRAAATLPGAPTAELGPWGLPRSEMTPVPGPRPPRRRMSVDTNVVIDMARNDFHQTFAVATLSKHDMVMSPCIRSELRSYLVNNFFTREGIAIIPDSAEATKVVEIVKKDNAWKASATNDYFGFNKNQEIDLHAYVQASASGVPFMTEDADFVRRIAATDGGLERTMRDKGIVPTELHLVMKSPGRVDPRLSYEQLLRKVPMLRLYFYQRPQ